MVSFCGEKCQPLSSRITQAVFQLTHCSTVCVGQGWEDCPVGCVPSSCRSTCSCRLIYILPAWPYTTTKTELKSWTPLTQRTLWCPRHAWRLLQGWPHRRPSPPAGAGSAGPGRYTTPQLPHSAPHAHRHHHSPGLFPAAAPDIDKPALGTSSKGPCCHIEFYDQKDLMYKGLQ